MTHLLPVAFACVCVVVTACGGPRDPLTHKSAPTHVSAQQDHSAATCTTDGDCAAREVCVDGACTDTSNSPDGCTRDSSGACTNDNTTLPTCTTDADCADGTTCQQGSCVRGTTSAPEVACTVFPDSCGAGQRCYPQGVHVTDGLCGDVGPVQLGGACEDVPFGGDLACARGLVCSGSATASSQDDGVCLTVCVANSDCGVDGQCAPFAIDGVTTSFGACRTAGG